MKNLFLHLLLSSLECNKSTIFSRTLYNMDIILNIGFKIRV